MNSRVRSHNLTKLSGGWGGGGQLDYKRHFRFVEQFAQSGCDCFVFQIEKTDSSSVGELIAKIRESGMKVNCLKLIYLKFN